MSTRKTALDAQIREFIAEGDSDTQAARRLYLYNASVVLQENPRVGFRILDEISHTLVLLFVPSAFRGHLRLVIAIRRAKTSPPEAPI